jgi:uncharacterized OsmC-like protein
VGSVQEYLDKTSTFSRITMSPKIVARDCSERDIQRALELAEKYSLIWQSITAEITLSPEIRILK